MNAPECLAFSLGQEDSGALAAVHAQALAALLQCAPVGMELYDLELSRTLECNPGLEALTGQSRQHLMQGQLADLFADAMGLRTDNAFEPDRHPGRLALARSGFVGSQRTVLKHSSGRVLQVMQSSIVVLTQEGRRLLWTILQDISDSQRLEQALRDAAQQDRLTGLANRTTLMTQVAALAKRTQEDRGFGFALLFLDFDRFKLVNDTLGHETGDDLLSAIAQRLRAGLPCSSQHPGSLAARLGGDEFVVLVPGMASPAQARPFAERLLAALASPYELRGREIHSSASIGVALMQGPRPEHDIALGSTVNSADPTAISPPEASSCDPASQAQSLLRDADTAMYEAKRRGRRTVVFFDDTLREAQLRTARIEQALRGTAARGELRALYQPVVCLESGRPVAAEALVRWQHPQLGQLAPSEFLQAAEEGGHMLEIGRWMLAQACRDWALWQAEGGSKAPPYVCVNLARAQTADPVQLLATVREALGAVHMPPGALQLELSEGEVMQSSLGTRELVQALRTLGVRVAMDQFGSGSSSLAWLRDIPFDAVKIDRSFVADLARNPQVMAVAHATIQVIENLGMASVAEGIEDATELASLQALGCRFGQGYLFGRPTQSRLLLATFMDS